jgi:hypothetical protein
LWRCDGPPQRHNTIDGGGGKLAATITIAAVMAVLWRYYDLSR